MDAFSEVSDLFMAVRGNNQVALEDEFTVLRAATCRSFAPKLFLTISSVQRKFNKGISNNSQNIFLNRQSIFSVNLHIQCHRPFNHRKYFSF